MDFGRHGNGCWAVLLAERIHKPERIDQPIGERVRFSFGVSVPECLGIVKCLGVCFSQPIRQRVFEPIGQRQPVYVRSLKWQTQKLPR